MFENSNNKPDVLMVISMYPLGTLSDNSKEFMTSIEVGATEDLGNKYHVSAHYNAESHDLESVSLYISEAK